MEFDWNNYLETNKSIAVPEELFSHVEASLNNGIKQGMLLEVCHKNNPDIYWIAEITMVCGHLLRIKFIGADTDFWCDISNTKVHPLGWCGKYDELVEPPDEINEKCGDTIIDIMKKALLVGQSVSIEALNNKGMSPIDRIKVGMKVEIQNVNDPYRYWIATVCENVGGRLLLRYDGADEDLQQFWIFFSNPRLSSFGYVTNKGSPWQFKYPGKVNRFSCKNKLSAQLRQSAEESIKEPTPPDLFQPAPTQEAHSFVAGMKLEMLSPSDMRTVRPATVTTVFNNLHFLVTADEAADDTSTSPVSAWLCDNMHPYIFPIGWAHKHNFPLKSPKTWKEGPFNWDEYLTMTSSVPAPEYCFGKKEPMKGIEVDMKLEAVNPLSQEEIHVATIAAIEEHLVCVELIPIAQKYWYAQDSDLLFPVGWCDSNNYELHIPDTSDRRPQRPEEPQGAVKEDIKTSSEWCDRIYFNYKCYAGPSISRNKLSQLPKHVGPGPLSLVLKEVLNKIISASYKPAKLLKDWEHEGPPEEGMRLELLRAKLKTSTYHAYVCVAREREHVPAFCGAVCARLQACPALFGPAEYPAGCPHRCHIVDKSTFHNGTERRGRPKGSVNGKRKKKKTTAPEKREKEMQPSQESEGNRDGESVESEHSAASTPPSESGTRPNSPDCLADCRRPGRRKRDPRAVYPKLEMKTRGAKLPNFALQMKEAHWDKKDVETMYGSSCAKKVGPDSDTEHDTNESSCQSRGKLISDVSDAEEPELKKLRCASYDPPPSDAALERRAALSWIRGRAKLAPNPLHWSVDDVYAYLSSTDDCKLIADKMKQEEIDGQAFIMLDLPIIREFLHMKKEFALQLCKHIALVRWYYIDNFEEAAP
ncbi:PREDICTED: scm-like with four MBT domains protein 2 isoform X1 [Papilio xuthus]|uniref:Scm-like with four MBT domains protein 2 isoform X1 n=2 Tax=Papilio xuthus TaxID=66420 RepID=A0AAJ6ZPZ1_PAPXU|nr:PREDICTED: scm-like with four MBT domains protein 2 isoform X1 [Papilio xuthus]